MNDQVTFMYVNHRGEHQKRRVIPTRLYKGTSQWHRKEQWLLEGFDVDKNANRTFSMSDISDWEDK